MEAPFDGLLFRRNVPFTRKVRFLFKTRLIFPRINGPIISILTAQTIPSMPTPPPHPPAFVILSVPVVGSLSENLCLGVWHLSILLEAVNIVPFSIFQLKICLFRDCFRYFYNKYFLIIML